jgi:hypothetical protein
VSHGPGARRTASIRAREAAAVLRVSPTLLEQTTASCQQRFDQVLRRCLAGGARAVESASVAVR